MRIKREPKRFAAGVAALALVVAACGGDDNGDDADTTDPPAEDDAGDDGDDGDAGDDGDDAGSIGECETINDGYPNAVAAINELDMSGMTVNVGSKDFVEQFVLGQLLVVALEAADAEVTDNVNLGGTVVNRDALEANEIDAYWEYNGTGWTVHLAQEDPSFDRLELANDVCVQDLEENSIRWLGVSPFNNTYGFATAGDGPAAGLDLEGMAEYVLDNPDATVCMETEYPNRPDGLVLFEDAYDFTMPQDQTEILETGVIYDETASGNCTFGEIFTTDGRIPALGLDVIDDPGVHILYNVSLTMPDSVYSQAPDDFQAIAETILQPLDNDTMAELNRRVSADGEDPRDVAEAFLTDQGLIGEGAGSGDTGDGESAMGDCATIDPDYGSAVSSVSELDMSGMTVNVGSKDFVEQFVLGQLLVVALEAAGAEVTDNVNLGGTVVNRDALEANEIDAYWEYNGTGWTVHLAQEDPSFDRLELANDVCVQDLEENSIRWLGVSPFNNTYGFATAGDGPAAGLDLEGMAEYVLDNPDATVCMETEYPNRPDGLVLFEDAYDFTMPQDQTEILETGVIYDETASGNCTFGEIFTTDGRIPALGLDVIDDPGVHILYNVSLTMPDSVYSQAPDDFQAIAETILQPLDNDTMAELNRRVSADGEDPRDVAEDFLTEEGVIG